MRKIIVFVILLVNVFVNFSVLGEILSNDSFTPYFYLDHSYRNIVALMVNRYAGAFRFPLNQPIETAELAIVARDHFNDKCTAYEKKWLVQLARELKDFAGVGAMATTGDNEWQMQGNIHPFYCTSTSTTYRDYDTDLIGAVAGKNYCFFNRTTLGKDFKRDPLFQGDTREWLVGRAQDAYMTAGTGTFKLFLGRLYRNWGPIGEAGLILSNHPYSYDHIGFSASARRACYSFYTARFKDEAGVRNGRFLIAKRYFAMHRMDLNLSRNLKLAVTESIIYGGENRSFEFGYLNPANFFYGEIRNSATEGNVLYALDVLYRPHNKVNLWGQLLIDDMVVNNEPGQNDRARYPDRYILIVKPYFMEPIIPGLDFALKFIHASNEVYKSKNFWENYTYGSKALGFPANSFDSYTVSCNYWGLPPFIGQCDIFFQRQGESNVTDIFAMAKQDFLIGTVQSSYGLNLILQLFYRHNLNLSLELGFEYFENYHHIRSDSHTEWQFRLDGAWHFNKKLVL